MAYVRKTDTLVDDIRRQCENMSRKAQEQFDVDSVVFTDAQEVERFYPTVVTNLTDVASRMSRANISDDPNIAQCINDLSTLAGGLNVDLLSHNQTSRDVAVLTLQALATKFRGFL